MNIVELARNLSVSIATVSRALRPETAHLVGEPLRRRIQKAARDFDYDPSPAARGMRAKRLLTISVVIPYEEYIFLGEYHARLLFSIMMETKALGLDVRMRSVDNLRKDFVECMWDAGMGSGGVIYLGSTLSADNVNSLRRLKRPIVVIKSSLPPDHSAAEVPVSVVGVDNVQGGYLAAKHLLELGHRRIGFANAPRILHHDAYERLLGIKKAFVEFAVPYDPELYMECNPDFYSGVRSWREYYSARRPTAMIGMNDELVRGLIKEAAVDGIRCPENLAVVGYDDSRLAYFVSPGLTSVRQSLDEVGKACVDNLYEAIRAGGSSEKRDVVFAPVLVVRESSGVPIDHSQA